MDRVIIIIIDPLSRSGDPKLGDCIVTAFLFDSQKKVSSLLPNTQNTQENPGVIIPQINVARTHKYVWSRHKMRSRDCFVPSEIPIKKPVLW